MEKDLEPPSPYRIGLSVFSLRGYIGFIAPNRTRIPRQISLSLELIHIHYQVPFPYHYYPLFPPTCGAEARTFLCSIFSQLTRGFLSSPSYIYPLFTAISVFAPQVSRSFLSGSPSPHTNRGGFSNFHLYVRVESLCVRCGVCLLFCDVVFYHGFHFFCAVLI